MWHVPKQGKNFQAKKKAFFGWVTVIIGPLLVLAVVIGYKVWPEERLLAWLWWLLWGGVFPFLLFLTVKVLSQHKDDQ